MKIKLGMFCTALGVAAALYGSRAQSVDIFFQEVEGGTARPLTTEEKSNLLDPLFRLVLASQPNVTRLSDIENLIQPDSTKRTIFVVDEEIRDFKQPQNRRSVIVFDGANGDAQLKGNIALSIFFSSAAMPDQDVELEAWGWDEKNGVYNFYKLDRQGHTTPALSWKLRSSSKGADRLIADQRKGTCLRCHTSGVPIMKELSFPWNNWHSFTSPANYLTHDGPSDQRWPVASDPHFPPLGGGDTLETIIKGAIIRFNNQKFSDLVPAGGQGERTIRDAKVLLKPLFDTTEINLESAQQKSGLHPLPDPTTQGPSQPINIPNNFLLQADLLAGIPDIVGLGITDAKGFSAAAVVQPNEYKALVGQSHLQITRGSGEVLAGDTNFAWLTPVMGFAATHWIDTLLQQKILSPDLVAAVLSVDLETPIFADRRKSLLEAVPDQFVVTPGEGYPDKLASQIIATLEAQHPAAGSPQEEFLSILKTTSPLQELKSRVAAYRNRVVTALGNPATRQSELARLFDLLIQRRRLVATYPDPNRFPMFGSLIESDALFPLPVH